MPELEQDIVIEILSPNSSLPTTPHILSPISTGSHESDADEIGVNLDWHFSLHGHIEIPSEPTLQEILITAANDRELNVIESIKLQVVSLETSLQHIPVHIPFLTELILDGSVISSLRDLGTGLSSLKILKVAQCGLTSLDGTFSLQMLEELYAQDNKISSLSPCNFLPNIQVINLKGNLLKDIVSITLLSDCSKLRDLVLDNNKSITEIPKYRSIIRSILPNLKTLDGDDVSSEEMMKEYERCDVIPEVGGTQPNRKPSDDRRHVSSVKKYSSPSEENGQFVVHFPPKVLSPKFECNTNGNITSSMLYK